MKPSLLALATLAAALAATGCSRSTPSPPPAPTPESTPAARTAGPFRDVSSTSGVDFRHFNGRSGRRYIVEIIAGGGGFLDYDGDGDLDLYLVDGAPLGGAATGATPTSRLFRNDGRGRFGDVTTASRVGFQGFGLGLAVGDVDNDGDPDLYVTSYGEDVLYRNRGDGTFDDVTAETGIREPLISTSAAFLDYDRDGDLDLYVANYLDFDPARFEPCLQGGLEVYCSPNHYAGQTDHLWQNLYQETGELGFRDVSIPSGIAPADGKGLGVVAGDVDGDGDPDLYVANDGTPNFLFLNQLSETGKPTFLESATLLGCAYGEAGKSQAGMGVDFGDFDVDGDADIFVTNLDGETNALYRNEDAIAMLESSYSTGLGAISLPFVGFGTRFLDFDADADLDIMVANGHVIDNIAELQQGAHFAQDLHLFENQGGQFREVLASLPERDRLARKVGRALATADWDDDGDLDVLIANNDDTPFLLENVAARRYPVAGLRLEGLPPGSPRDAYGARVTLRAEGLPLQVRDVMSARSYLAANDPRILLALPRESQEADVAIRWPSGKIENVKVMSGAYHHIVEGRGVVRTTPFAPPR